jgi:hypothetical protein
MMKPKMPVLHQCFSCLAGKVGTEEVRGTEGVSGKFVLYRLGREGRKEILVEILV